eukprot:130898-Lingulodinium_polyedra.AAC.1
MSGPVGAQPNPEEPGAPAARGGANRGGGGPPATTGGVFAWQNRVQLSQRNIVRSPNAHNLPSEETLRSGDLSYGGECTG